MSRPRAHEDEEVAELEPVMQWTKEQQRIYASQGSFDKLDAGMYSVAQDGMGRKFLSKESLPNENVIPDCSDILKDVDKEVSRFWSLRDRYRKLGVPHKRGILLYGPPGAGKSVILREIGQRHIKNDGIIMFLRDEDDMEMSMKIIGNVEAGRPLMLLLEDIDKLCSNGYDQELCDLLDGNKASRDSYLVISTTNYIHQIPERLVNRPSRYDTVIEVPVPSKAAIFKYLTTLYPSMSKLVSKQLATKLTGYSFAHVKEAGLLYMLYGSTPAEILSKLQRTYKVTQAVKYTRND